MAVASFSGNNIRESFLFTHREITEHAARTGDANPIHFSDPKLRKVLQLKGTPVQQGLIQSTLSGCIARVLQRCERKVPIPYHVELTFHHFVYADQALEVTGGTHPANKPGWLVLELQGTQKNGGGQTMICFSGKATFRMIRLPKPKPRTKR